MEFLMLMLMVLLWEVRGQAEGVRVCKATTESPHNNLQRYYLYKRTYQHCHVIDGNLEIIMTPMHQALPSSLPPDPLKPHFLNTSQLSFHQSETDQSGLDFSFLTSITEVTGYVMLMFNYVDVIPLVNLRVIRGHDLFMHRGRAYALYVALNYQPDQPGVGLKLLSLHSLTEILQGGVFMFHNNQLCHSHSIDWRLIVTQKSAHIHIEPYDSSHPRRKCEECREECRHEGILRCWSPSACQHNSRCKCERGCHREGQCCDVECVGGCHGPSSLHCWSCRHFSLHGACVRHCPPQQIYSPRLHRHIRNPHAMFAYKYTCVKKCPDHMIADKGACVVRCGEGSVLQGDSCVSCVKDVCDKTCQMEDTYIHSGNIELLRGCTSLHGALRILQSSLTGDPYRGIAPMKLQQLSLLQDVREVTEYVQVQANIPNFKDLEFLRNLRVIHGRKLDKMGAALHIWHTSLHSLKTPSLTTVNNGDIFIANNSQLCYVDSIDWNSLLKQRNQHVFLLHNKAACEGCNEECMGGCMGETAAECMACKNFIIDGRCVPACKPEEGLYKLSERECGRCDPRCINGCHGPVCAL